MRAKNLLVILLCLCNLAAPVAIPNAMADSFSDQASDWLEQNLPELDAAKIHFSQQKITFKGCRQRDYQLSVAQPVGPTLTIEAIAHYEKGSLHSGLMAQRVKSQALELVSWWEVSNLRLGLSTKIRNEHEIALPLAQTVRLPTSHALGVYVEFPGLQESDKVALSAIHETWQSQPLTLEVPWQRRFDNQLMLSYQMAF